METSTISRKVKVAERLSREEMADLVARICAAEGTEYESEADIELFLANCNHPSGTDLIFWPDLVPDFPSGHEPTVAEMVDLAMYGSVTVEHKGTEDKS
jgi:hypothetical protein